MSSCRIHFPPNKKEKKIRLQRIAKKRFNKLALMFNGY